MMIPDKLKFPKFLENIPCKVVLYKERLDETSGSPNADVIWNGKCIWSEVSKEVVTADRRSVRSSGRIYIDGDIAPGMGIISGGVATVFAGLKNECVLMICEAMRARNPDGTVNHTRLTLL